MPSPAGHTCASLVLHVVAQQNGWFAKRTASWWQAPVLAVILGNLPDIDLALGWIVTGNAIEHHQLYTHNVFFALGAGVLVALAAKRDWLPAGIWAFCLVGLHVFLDAGIGPSPGRAPTLGLRPLWPVSSMRVGLPIALVPMLHYGTPDQILAWRNMGTVLYELVVFGLPLLILQWRHQRKSTRPVQAGSI